MIEASSGQILAERAIKERPALAAQLIDGFGRNEEQGLLRAAVVLEISLDVAVNAERVDAGHTDRELWQSSSRGVDLDDIALHESL